MLGWKPFHYKSLDEIASDIKVLNLRLPVRGNVEILGTPVEIKGLRIKNRLGIQPMEGQDADPNGTPTELTFRRYKRYAKGGAGIIWLEACAVNKLSKSNPRMLMPTEENVKEFRKLASAIRDNAWGGKPYSVVQIEFCGVLARTDGVEQMISFKNPHVVRENSRVMSDDEMEAIEDDYVKSAMLVKEAGFDCVDIKSCHGYLVNELMASFTRENSKYGCSFENRTRFLLNIIDKIRKKVDMDICTRLSAYDVIPYPYGWGVDKNDSTKADLTEPLKLVGLLIERNLKLFNISATIGPHSPHLQRPYDKGSYYPKEHQLVPTAAMHSYAEAIKKAYPQILVMASTFTWPRQFAANIAAGGVEEGMYDIAGFGRQAFAYPDFPKDIILKGGMNPKKCCVTCSGCIHMIRYKCPAGCIVRDKKLYLPIYKKAGVKPVDKLYGN